MAVVEMFKRVAINGHPLSKRQAAQRAALLKDFDLELTTQNASAPSPQLAPTGRRNSPIGASLQDGFDEHAFRHKKLNAGVGHAFDATTKRLERKHRKWTSAGKIEAAWLDDMADAWMAATYPQEIQRQGLDPVEVCLTAASRAGEREFAERYLLPLLEAQTACLEGRQQ